MRGNGNTLFITFAGIAAAGFLVGYAIAEDIQPSDDTQVVYRAESRQPLDGPAQFFTGNAKIEPVFPASESAPFSGAYVTFEPGARSAWHSHPAGQHIVVTAGVGRTGTLGGQVEEIRAGDAIWCPPGVTHWHGAAPDSAMTHFVITGSKDGSAVEWLDKVTDEQYNAAASAE